MLRVEGELYNLGYRTFTPKLRKWVSHARRRTAVYRPVLSRYLFVDIDHPRQSFGMVRNVHGVETILSSGGSPLSFTTDDVADFILRQLKGEWDEIEGEKLPVGAKIAFMDGPHEESEAVITAMKGNKVSYKIIGTAQYGTTYAFSVRAA
jgi:transcription antitermination factor NusG